MAPRRKANGREFSTSPKSEAMRFAFNAAAHAYWKHPTISRVALQNSEESSGHSRLSAARLSPIFDEAIPGALSARWPERLRCGDVVRRSGMGRGRNRAAPDPAEIDGAADHCRHREHGRGPHSRIRADAGAN